MKTFKFLFSVLIISLVSLTFTSCSDDDKDEPTPYFTNQELVGTTWTGQNSAQDNYEIKIISQNELTLNIVSKSGTVYVDNEKLSYTYDSGTGKFVSEYDSPITGQITKTTMTFKISGEQITLKKK